MATIPETPSSRIFAARLPPAVPDVPVKSL